MNRDQKVKKLCKQARDQRNGPQCYQKMKINPKAFAIPILSAITSAKIGAARIGIANALAFSDNTWGPFL